jgi:hypothetical protein
MHGQVGALTKVLSQQAIGILVRSALPRALRIVKIDVDFGRQRKATMIRKFLARSQVRDERGDNRLGVLACRLGQHHVTGLTLDQGRDVGVVRSGQDIALPTTRHRPIFNRCGLLTD